MKKVSIILFYNKVIVSIRPLTLFKNRDFLFKSLV